MVLSCRYSGGFDGRSRKPVGNGVGEGDGDLRFLKGLSSDNSSKNLSPILYIIGILAKIQTVMKNYFRKK